MPLDKTPAPFILVCGLDADGLYAGPVPAYRSPLDQTYPLPANGVGIAPPDGDLPPHHAWQLNAGGDGWIATPDYRRVTLYDTTTGQPLLPPALGECLPDHVTLEVPPPPGEREVIRWDAGHRVWQRVPDRRGESYWLPDGSHHVIREIGEIPPADALTEPPPPTLEALREQRRAEINRWRDEQENGGIEHAGHCWDTDEASLQRINAVLLAGTNPLGIWTSADNVDVPMTLEDMQGLFAAIVTRGSAIHARQREMKQAIDGMSRDELEAFQPGWQAM
ncbi:DUF4376 domain-containing protein [Laribacter hongkongensis]|uniref:DUF4376 domain-containing protein n=1 Tax=Laribacter hongkongensis TaxID=168471 RepID=UPI001EFC5121|nr:DUF4376 domain-containing protein [Laribacter hongkongensis]MCG9031416.1 DUF4376 domain-containing protein [Laribacter hongkongensis]MCG9091636.1 DUF4376 domain-containing protein [Laribacter hongkongensis]